MGADLPPMLARPSQAMLARKPSATEARRWYVDARAAYRSAVLIAMAERLEGGPKDERMPDPFPFGLTESQGYNVRRQMALVLRNRAEKHEGRLRV